MQRGDEVKEKKKMITTYDGNNAAPAAVAATAHDDHDDPDQEVRRR